MKTKLPLKRASLLFCIFLLGVQVFAQTRKVTGKVTNSTSGASVQSVSILIKGSSAGTSTDANGNYSISVPGNDAVLVFSSVGYAAQEVLVGDKEVINVVMVESTEQLTDVVVVGYGTQKKREVTSAVTKVSAEQFNKGNISDVAQLLQGKVAGLSIAKTGGDPNSPFSIRLRGLSTLGANTQPLVVVDGQIGADLNTVDPNDIASIDVLKDGSAAAIYGTRGSQGVIIITTKAGRRNTSVVSYSGMVSSEKPVRFTQHMNAQEFRDLGKGTDYEANTDWYDEITETAISQIHNFSLSGGNASGTSLYNASVNYRNINGVAITTGFNQLNGRVNLTQKALNNKLIFNIGLTGTRKDADVGFPETFKYAAIYNPTAPVYSDDPAYDLTGGGYYEANFIDYANPVAALQQNSHTLETKRMNFEGSATWEIFSGLKFLVRYAQQNISNFQQAYLPRDAYHLRNFLGVSGFARKGYALKADFETYNQLYENTLTYDKKMNNLTLSAVAGYSYQYFLNQGESAAGGNFVTDASADNLNAALDFASGLGTVTSYKNASKLVAFFGRVNLSYNNFAFLSASLRREGSTQFGENNKWGMFPAASGGLDVDKLINIPVVNTLKVRASYGVTGSLPPQPYLSFQWLAATGSYFYSGNNVYLQSYAPQINANPDLKWEQKKEYDFGLDFSLLANNRLTGTFDYYNRTTSVLIFQTTVPVPPNAAPTTYLNVGELQSSGVELALSFDVFKGRNFSWNTSGNFSSYNVKLTKLNVDADYIGATNLGTPGQEATQITRAVEGEDIGLLWGAVYKGIDKDGKYLFDDGNGGTTFDEKKYTTQIGNGLPDFEFGWTNTFKYRNFDLNFFLRGSIGHDLINTYRAFYENPNIATSYNVVNTKFFNPDITDAQKFSSLHVEKASFVKLDNATLGYNFKMSDRNLIKTFRVYLSAQNLFVITDYTGVDPEVRYTDDFDGQGPAPINVLAPGVDRRETWVSTRTFSFGVNVGF